MHWPRAVEQEAGTLGLTPLVDVVFLLLIFFVVTTSFSETRLALVLPSAETAQSTQDAALLVVSLAPDGGLRVDGEELAWEALDARIAAAAADEIEGIEIRADESVAHGRVVEVLDRARSHDIVDVEITTQKR